jgi:hypothetical protein
MVWTHRVGDLVHVPQSVRLLDCDDAQHSQMSIPVRVCETTKPHIGVVTAPPSGGYIRIFCDGDIWSVRDQNVYRVRSRADGEIY